jgi:hypothetical protein
VIWPLWLSQPYSIRGGAVKSARPQVSNSAARIQSRCGYQSREPKPRAYESPYRPRQHLDCQIAQPYMSTASPTVLSQTFGIISFRSHVMSREPQTPRCACVSLPQLNGTLNDRRSFRFSGLVRNTGCPQQRLTVSEPVAANVETRTARLC